jgi:hypothetical protein
MPIVLLRDIQTGSYFAKDSEWVPEPRLAHNFEQIEAAAQHAIDHKMKNVDAVVMSPDYNLILGTRIDFDSH